MPLSVTPVMIMQIVVMVIPMSATNAKPKSTTAADAKINYEEERLRVLVRTRLFCARTKSEN